MNRRTSIGMDEEELPLDVSAVLPKPATVPAPAAPLPQVRDIAVSQGFQGQGRKRPNYSRITGRTEQFNVRIRADTKAEIYAIADENRWGLGETVERLLEAYRARARQGGPVTPDEAPEDP